MEIPILFENDDCLVIDKPAGLVVHSDGRTKEETVTDWVISKYPSIKGVGEPLVLASGEQIDRPGIVHRLDRDTSGALLIAKTPRSFALFKKQFHDRKMKKVYNAFAYGLMTDGRGVIDRAIGRSPNDFRRYLASRGARGEMRDAVTRYRVIHTTGKGNLGVSYLELEPKTGRTHQIRVHLQAINHPVVCDPLYASGRPSLLGFKRLALHARSITFIDQKGQKITVEAPYPADFQAAIAEIKTL